MISDAVARRTFLEKAGLAALGAVCAVQVREVDGQIAVPNSAGTGIAKLKAPPNACDCHMHIYDAARFPMAPSPRVPPTDAAVAQYRLLQRRIGTARVVVVTPRNYATQNQVTVDAVAQLGARARAVAVVHPSITDAELKSLHAAGVRGIRFSLNDPATAVVTLDMVEPLSKRVADLGWHVQFNVAAQQVIDWADLLRRLPSPIVYPEAATIAQAFIKAAPERMVWGSDWPHPTEAPDRKPDDALLFDLLSEWAPDEVTRRRILVENPEALYDF